MQRRVLPPRQSRGRPPRRLVEAAQLQEKKHYQDIFGDQQIRKTPVKIDTNNEVTHNYIDMRKSNIVSYPYTRGLHYIVSLQSLKRVQDTHSYVYDRNILKVNFSQQQVDFNGSKLSQLLNRRMLGLPLKPKGEPIKKTKAKNISHSYLFACQDRKYKIDISITELKYIVKNLQKLIHKNKIMQYSSIKKDMQLIEIINDGSIELEAKKQLLQNKLRLLQQKKIEMENGFYQEDKVYFPCTLNQRLFNEVQTNQEQFTMSNLLTQINKPDLQLQQFDKINDASNQVERIKVLNNLFAYQFGSFVSISQQNIKKLTGKSNYKKIFKKLDTKNSQPDNQYYFVNDIILPCAICDFANQELFEKAQHLVSQRLYQISDTIFYIFKACWKKLFNRNVEIKILLKPLTKDQYTQMALKDIESIKNQKKKSITDKLPNDEKVFKYPSLDSIINFQKLKQARIPVHSNNEQFPQSMIFKTVQPICIDTKQYLLILYFHLVYKCLGEFVKSTASLSLNRAENILCYQQYSRIHPYLITMLNNSKFGSIDDTLRKICDLIAQEGHNLQIIKIMFDWNTKQRVGIIWTEQQLQKTELKQSQLKISSLQELTEQKQYQEVAKISKPKKKQKKY